MTLQTLQAHNILLDGKHLIEASAGTGKTYNITRLYLRLILEKGLTVEQILVMTFTKDATEEIRGRIGELLRESLNQWNQLIEQDEFYQHISTTVSENVAKARLKQALLYLDEASIMTLHGFCKRVLSQYAFNSGLSFNLDMDTSGKDLTIEACQDWYRLLSKDNESDFIKLSQFWPHPNVFIDHFANAIGRDVSLEISSVEEIVDEFTLLVKRVKSDLAANESFITEQLIDKKKGKDRETRQTELEELNQWLDSYLQNAHLVEQLDTALVMPAKFFHGGRFGKAVKAELVEIFASANQLKEAASKLVEKIQKASAFAIVKQGIIDIGLLIEEKKSKQKRLTFDDLISTLAKQLTKEDQGQLAQLLRQQYPVAMVDEFQDTDTAQFKILQAIYPAHLTHGLYLIGDPKQAIYGFRGGDIFTYLSARNFCQYQWVMDTNWRSSTSMINAYNRLFYGDSLASQGADTFGYNIPYQPVKASPKAIESAQLSLTIGNDKALQFVHFIPNQDPDELIKQDYRPQMALWCANKIKQLLDSECATVNPQDIAILVRDGVEANEIKEALQSLGLTGVFLSNKQNLWHCEQAKQLLLLLKAILFVENDRFFVAGLASGLLPFKPLKLLALQANELAWQNLKFEFLSLREEWQHKGFIAMAIHLLHDQIRVAANDKDRSLTNILHLFELLQSASERYKQPQELLYWFEQQVNIELNDAEAELRLESDEDLIKIVTQHGSKGLEYPIVFVPFASRYKDPTKVRSRKVNVINYHDQSGQQCIALGAESPHMATMAEEAYAESIRLLYVAVTRAERQCYLFVTNFEKSHLSPLGLTLKWQSGQNITTSINQLSEQQPQDIGVNTVLDVSVNAIASQNRVDINQAVVPQFKGIIERDWWLSSFTALSRNLRHVGVSVPDRDMESMTVQPQVGSHHAADMRFALTKGATAGNLLHDIFEHVDFAQPLWVSNIERYFDKYPDLLKPWRPEELCQWLEQIVNTPLLNNTSFTNLSRSQMLHETEFYFPMVSANATALTGLLAEHRNRYQGQRTGGMQVQLPHYQKLKGMMHGFIDLIFEHEGKFYVCDYKSNFLGDDYSYYNHDAMQENIETHHYDLQYLIYCLALHRQLKIAVNDYQAEQHFGGVIYCYLRGMNKTNKHQEGVFYRTILPEELDTLDHLFAEPKGGNQ